MAALQALTQSRPAQSAIAVATLQRESLVADQAGQTPVGKLPVDGVSTSGVWSVVNDVLTTLAIWLFEVQMTHVSTAIGAVTIAHTIGFNVP